MSKNEVNYTPRGSLSMENLVNRLLGKKEKKKKTRKQMLPDKNLLILTGRHPPVYILCTFTVFQKSSDFLSYALQPSCTRMGHIQL